MAQAAVEKALVDHRQHLPLPDAAPVSIKPPQRLFGQMIPLEKLLLFVFEDLHNSFYLALIVTSSGSEYFIVRKRRDFLRRNQYFNEIEYV